MQCIPLIFRPPRFMVLDQIEAAVAAYIFADSKELDGREVLVESTISSADRNTLRLLKPLACIDQDVIF